MDIRRNRMSEKEEKTVIITQGGEFTWKENLWAAGTLTLIIVGIVLYGLIEFELPKDRKEIAGKTEKLINDFNSTLDKKIKIGIVNDKKDLEVLRNSLQRKHGIENYPLEYLLEDYLRHLVDPPPISKVNKKVITPEKEKKIYDQIREMLLEEQKEKPFASIPEEERRILVALKSAIDGNNKQNSNFFIKELASVISTRHYDFLRMERVSRWSVPLAIFGIIATISLGILGILASIRKRGRKSRSESAEPVPEE